MAVCKRYNVLLIYDGDMKVQDNKALLRQAMELVFKYMYLLIVLESLVIL